jgi:hypothetical protein
VILLRTPDRQQRLEIAQLNLMWGSQGRPITLKGELKFQSVALSLEASLQPAAALYPAPQGASQPVSVDLTLEAAENKLRAQGTLASMVMPPALEASFELTNKAGFI